MGIPREHSGLRITPLTNAYLSLHSNTHGRIDLRSMLLEMPRHGDAGAVGAREVLESLGTDTHIEKWLGERRAERRSKEVLMDTAPLVRLAYVEAVRRGHEVIEGRHFILAVCSLAHTNMRIEAMLTSLAGTSEEVCEAVDASFAEIPLPPKHPPSC